MAHPAIEDICDDSELNGEIGETREDLEFDHIEHQAQVKGLKIKKA